VFRERSFGDHRMDNEPDGRNNWAHRSVSTAMSATEKSALAACSTSDDVLVFVISRHHTFKIRSLFQCC